MPQTMTFRIRVRIRGRWALKLAGWALRRFRPVYRTSKGGAWTPLPGTLVVTWRREGEEASK